MSVIVLALLLAQEPKGPYLADTDAKCATCHEAQREDWTGSVHALHGVGCVKCHGTDEVDPANAKLPHLKRPTFRIGARRVSGKRRTESPELCGSCHTGVLESFKGSTHYELTQDEEEQKVKGCVSCHGHHRTGPASIRTILAESCVKCHKSGSENLKKGEGYAAAAGTVEGPLRRLEERLRERKPGIATAEEAARLEAWAQALKSMRIEQHSCRFKDLERKAKPLSGALEAAHAGLDVKERAFGRRWVPLMGFLAAMGALLYLVRAWCIRRYGRHA